VKKSTDICTTAFFICAGLVVICLLKNDIAGIYTAMFLLGISFIAMIISLVKQAQEN
jgi:hypothetical protein